MQFSFFLALFTFVSFVAALPSGHTFMRASCDIAGCVAALAPSVIACSAAAVEAGANVLADASCLAAAANDVLNLPSDCDQCLDEFDVPNRAKSAAKSVGKKVSGAAKSVADETEDAVDSIGDKIGSFF